MSTVEFSYRREMARGETVFRPVARIEEKRGPSYRKKEMSGRSRLPLAVLPLSARVAILTRRLTRRRAEVL